MAATIPVRPAGLLYQPELLSTGEHSALFELVQTFGYDEIAMRGQIARRTSRQFGYGYGYESRSIEPVEPIPASMLWLRERCAALGSLPPDELVECLVNRYPPGAGIGWHRDAPMFGAKVVGVSVGASCTMRFRREVEGVTQSYALLLEPRSGYVLAGAARASWQHSIPSTRALRYSVTFRTLTATGSRTWARVARSRP